MKKDSIKDVIMNEINVAQDAHIRNIQMLKNDSLELNKKYQKRLKRSFDLDL
jgi:hypothetical protein